jgi:hypothetical protein
LIDRFGNDINNGDLLVQSSEWGLHFFRVRDDPEAHARLWVYALDYGPDVKKALGKSKWDFINLTALIGTGWGEQEALAHAGLSG